jgi:hypothetical protein
MNLSTWVARWRIPAQAMDELRQIFGIPDLHVVESSINNEISETALINLIKLEASRKGARLWRNNVGATYGEGGSYIRFGLANESAAVNKIIKSADLIGIKPVLITPDMVGKIIGQFISREVKSPGWHYTGTEREQAQLRWAHLIISLGGNACFATSDTTI